MTTAEAPPSRELVVSRDVLLVLGRSTRESLPAEAAQRLTELDLLGPDARPLPFAAPTADAVGAPLATVQIVASRPGGTHAADVWVGTTRAVLHARTSGDAAVVSVGRSLLPQLLVRALGLGPRPRSDKPPFTASAAQVAEAVRGDATPPWGADETVDGQQLWRVSWETADGAVGDLAVLDLGDQGVWRPESATGEGLSWAPVDSGTVWCRLGDLFAVTLEDRIIV